MRKQEVEQEREGWVGGGGCRKRSSSRNTTNNFFVGFFLAALCSFFATVFNNLSACRRLRDWVREREGRSLVYDRVATRKAVLWQRARNLSLNDAKSQSHVENGDSVSLVIVNVVLQAWQYIKIRLTSIKIQHALIALRIEKTIQQSWVYFQALKTWLIAAFLTTV